MVQSRNLDQTTRNHAHDAATTPTTTLATTPTTIRTTPLTTTLTATQTSTRTSTPTTTATSSQYRRHHQYNHNRPSPPRPRQRQQPPFTKKAAIRTPSTRHPHAIHTPARAVIVRRLHYAPTEQSVHAPSALWESCFISLTEPCGAAGNNPTKLPGAVAHAVRRSPVERPSGDGQPVLPFWVKCGRRIRSREVVKGSVHAAARSPGRRAADRGL